MMTYLAANNPLSYAIRPNQCLFLDRQPVTAAVTQAPTLPDPSALPTRVSAKVSTLRGKQFRCQK